MDAGLKAAAASEGVAGSDEDDIEPAHLARDLILDPAAQVTPDLRASDRTSVGLTPRRSLTFLRRPRA
jgi:hypothetical protein